MSNRKAKLRWHVDGLHKLLANVDSQRDDAWYRSYVEHMEAIVAVCFIGDSDRKSIHTRDLSGRLELLALFQEAEAARLAAVGDGDDDNAKARSLREAAYDNRAVANELYDMKAKL